MFWIIFKWNFDIIGAKIEGDEATLYWNKAAPKKRKLERVYTYEEIASLHPMNIQQGIIAVTGMQNIRDLRITKDNIDWNVYFKGNR